jgi:hypothetical protein
MFAIRRYEMLVRLKEFGTAHAELFPDTSGGGRLFAAFGAAVDDLQSHVVAQAGGTNATRQATTAKTAARRLALRRLDTLTRTAQIVTAGTPGFDEKLRLPKSRSDQRLVAVARAIVQDVTPFADQIVAHNLPATFLSEVTAAIDALDTAIQTQAQAAGARAAARAAIQERLAAAFAMAAQLDTVVANQCGNDAVMLAKWQSARHQSSVSVPYPRRKQPAESTPAQPAPAPPTPAPPTTAPPTSTQPTSEQPTPAQPTSAPPAPVVTAA